MASAVTIEDVARQAAVSIATVSRVLNSPEKVNPETRDLVEQAIHALGYRVNRAARNLRSNKTQVIAAVLDNLSDYISTQILEAIESHLLQADYTLQVRLIHRDSRRLLAYLDELQQQMGADGIIWMSHSTEARAYEQLSLRGGQNALLVDHFPAKAAQQDFRAFLFDYEAAFYQATQYLLGLGHHRIALLNLDWPDYLPVLMRTRGYQAALTMGGVRKSLVYEVPNTGLAASQNTLHQLLNIRPRPTAILCYDDTLAASLYRAAADYQINIPQELSIIGCGDFPLAEYLMPALSSFALPIARLAKEAAHHLLSHSQEQVTAIFEPEFVPRASVAAL